MELRVLYKCLLHVCQLIQHIIYKTVSGNTPEVRRLRTSFCQLLEQVGFAAWTTKPTNLCQVVAVAGNSVIYDGIFMDQLTSLFVCMSGSKARALRC